LRELSLDMDPRREMNGTNYSKNRERMLNTGKSKENIQAMPEDLNLSRELDNTIHSMFISFHSQGLIWDIGKQSTNITLEPCKMLTMVKFNSHLRRLLMSFLHIQSGSSHSLRLNTFKCGTPGRIRRERISSEN